MQDPTNGTPTRSTKTPKAKTRRAKAKTAKGNKAQKPISSRTDVKDHGAKANRPKVPKMSKAASQLFDSVLQYACASKGMPLTQCPGLSERLKAIALRWPGIEWMPLTLADRQIIDQTDAFTNLLEFRIEEITPDGRRVPLPDDAQRVGTSVLITTRLIDRVEVVVVGAS